MYVQYPSGDSGMKLHLYDLRTRKWQKLTEYLGPYVDFMLTDVGWDTMWGF